MSEKKITLKVPEAYKPLLEDIRLLKSDAQNPNKMSIKQKAEVWRSLQRHGWIYPIVTDRDGVFGDGEQRVEVCKEHNEFFAPVLRLSLSDAQRRILRQTLNKLHGKHSRRLDEEDYRRIIAAGEQDDLKQLLQAVGEKLPEDLGGPKESLGMVPDAYEILISGKNGRSFDESSRKTAFEKLQAEGYNARTVDI